MPSRSTLSNYPVLHSRDPEFVRNRLSADFGATRLEPGADRGDFAARVNHLQIGGLGLSYCEYASKVSLEFGEASFVRQIFNLSGSGQYEAGGHSGEITPGSWSSILPAEAPLKLDFQPGYRQLVLRIEFDALLRNLSALLGQDVDTLVFDGTGDRQPAMEALRRRVLHFATDFNERGVFFSDLAAAEVERMVIMKFLMCHRHNYTHLLMREPLPYPCPQCNTAVSARFNFCPNCKCNLHPACPQCKKEVTELDKFCPFCGSDLKTAVQEIPAMKEAESPVNP